MNAFYNSMSVLNLKVWLTSFTVSDYVVTLYTKKDCCENHFQAGINLALGKWMLKRNEYVSMPLDKLLIRTFLSGGLVQLACLYTVHW